MKLYSYWRSTAAYRVRIALNYKSLSYDMDSVNLLQPADSDAGIAYRELNPQGLVPSLLHGDVSLGQSTAIIEYLEDRFPEPPLLPEDMEQRAVARSMCQLVACDIHPLNNLRVLNYLRNELEQADEVVNKWYVHWIAEGFQALENLIGRHRGKYCVGDQVSMADVYLVPQLYNANRFDCDVTPYPNITGIAEALSALDAFILAAPESQPDAPSAQ